MFQRLHPKVRSNEVLQAALAVCERHGFMGMTRELVATQARVAPGTVSRYYGTMQQLRRAVARHAVQQENLPVLASMVASAEFTRYVKDDHLKKKVAKLIANR